MLQLSRIDDLRRSCDDARTQGLRVGLVPTMGFLHEGHRSLMHAARQECGFVVVTIFVNPLQFGPHEDLDRYPRDLRGDVEQCEEEGIDCVFAPEVAEMYPAGSRTIVHVEGLTESLCGAARPTHFDGVTTVVAKLFSIVGASRAYFGRKDAQQLAIITRMARDLDMPVEVIGCPLVREADGLARSSRNAYLSAGERAAAPVLFGALRAAAQAARAGERDPAALAAIVRTTVAAQPAVALEYVEVRDAASLEPVPPREGIDGIEGEVLVAVAARVGGTRLIDNIRLSVRGDAVTVDLGTGWTEPVIVSGEV